MSSAIRSNGPIQRVENPRHPSAAQFVEHAKNRGFRVLNQGTWPNATGWVALARPESTEVDVMVRRYRDHTYSVQSCDGNGTVDELLAE